MATTRQSGTMAAQGRRFSDVLVDMLAELGADYAFGLLGGAVAPLYDAVAKSRLKLVHARHEAGAAFAAIEASLATGRPAVVFTTTGPGLTNALTGIAAARWEGAHLVVVSGMTPAVQRGRWAFQETSAHTFPGFFAPGALFHYAVALEDAGEIDEVARRLAIGMARPNGFVACIGVPMGLQAARARHAFSAAAADVSAPAPDEHALRRCAEWLRTEPSAIWLGFGARRAARPIRELAERIGAPVFCSPRGKGIFPEDHPLFAGVTGLGGHASVRECMARVRPERVLVLGSRLGELTSFWEPDFVPPRGFIHVDVDPEVFGVAFPEAPTFGVQADIGAFVSALRDLIPAIGARADVDLRPAREPDLAPRAAGPVRPRALMQAIQRVVVEGSDAIVMTEAGNSFAWGTHVLRFQSPGRYRVSTGFGSMGHAASGVVGAAMAREGKAVAIVGDGAMLMLNELSTAVAHKTGAVWIVLNDARYGMTEQGMRSVGFYPAATGMPEADFAAIARAVGADGIRVDREAELDAALQTALEAPGPFVVDVVIDPDEQAPVGKRNQSLLRQWQSAPPSAPAPEDEP